ncbi:MAG: phytanoyl-CoA dioxygenase family protein [Planctomycetes bacterium]|nr:phytanoyl-CoA dioxygenase family protein [Planctomycetota bacterium]
MSTLSPDQIAGFRRDGYVIARIFDPADLLPVQREIAAHIDARARALHAAGLICDLHADAPFATRFGLLARQSDEMHGGNDIADILGDAMFALMRHPRLLDAVASLLGDEISLNPIQHLRAKPPAEQGRRLGYYEVPWHQDSGVTTPDADAALVVTAWTPLLGASEEMGCMRLIPGFHRRGHVRHVRDPQYGTCIDPALIPADGHVPAVCAPGEVVLMSQFTPHCSTPNRSAVCRWSMDLRYQAAGTPSGRAWLPSTLVRSRRDPAAEVRDPAVWRAAWREALSRPNPGARHRVEEAQPASAASR